MRFLAYEMMSLICSLLLLLVFLNEFCDCFLPASSNPKTACFFIRVIPSAVSLILSCSKSLRKLSNDPRRERILAQVAY